MFSFKKLKSVLLNVNIQLSESVKVEQLSNYSATHPSLLGVVGLDVLLVPPGQLLDGRLDVLHPPGQPHGGGGEVGVGPGPVPVPSLEKIIKVKL